MVARALLESTARDAVGWLAEHRHEFDPAHVSLPGRRSDKPVVELAFLVRALREAGAAHPGITELTDLVRVVGERPDHRRMPRPTRADLVAALFLFAAAYDGAGADVEERRRLQRLVDLRLLDTLEQPPHRAMEDRLALEWAGLRHDLPSWQALTDRSILGAGPNPALLGAAAAYQLTHVVMYLTAAGSRPARVDLPGAASSRQLLSTLLVRFVADRHWDLVGELLLSWHLLDLGASPVCEAAWAALLRAVGSDGSLAQPRGERDPRADADPAAEFEDRYHPTLVLALAAETWSRRSAPSPRPRTETTPPPVTAAGVAGSDEWAETGSAWLLSVLDGAEPGEARTVGSALVGLWICASRSERAAAALTGATEHAATLVRGVADWTRLPAGVALVVAALLEGVDTVPPGLAAFVDVAAAVLASRPVADPVLVEKRVLMHGLGRTPAPPAVPLGRAVERARRTPLDPGRAQIEDLLLAAGSVTLHGHRDVDLAVAERWVPELLLALATAQARRFDLVTAGRLTRAAVHLDGAARGRLDLAEVLLAAQRPGGEFGVLSGGGPGREERDVVLRLTVDCLWTLAEATTPWRLTRAIAAARA